MFSVNAHTSKSADFRVYQIDGYHGCVSDTEYRALNATFCKEREALYTIWKSCSRNQRFLLLTICPKGLHKLNHLVYSIHLLLCVE